jgi:hypothetical protein
MLHEGLPHLIRHTRAVGVEVEVFSNLVHVPDAVWDALCQPGVQLATSFYSDDAAEHMRVTGRNTLSRTQNNIVEALERSIPLRVGMVRTRRPGHSPALALARSDRHHAPASPRPALVGVRAERPPGARRLR